MLNRSKHLSYNFETRQVFNNVNANLNIEGPFGDVIDVDYVITSQPNLILQLTNLCPSGCNL